MSGDASGSGADVGSVRGRGGEGKREGRGGVQRDGKGGRGRGRGGGRGGGRGRGGAGGRGGGGGGGGGEGGMGGEARAGVARANTGGRGNTRGDRGSGHSPSGPYHHPPSFTSKGESRKEHRRRRQAEAVQRKADAEMEYFHQCQEEFASQNSRTRRGGGGGEDGAGGGRSEKELFSKQGAAGINFDKYDKIDVVVKGPGSDSAVPLSTFADLGKSGNYIPPFLSRNVELMGYDTPTPIQKRAIPLALAGCDLMCCAQTGSGKTCAFLLPIVSHLGGGGGGGGDKKAPPPELVVGNPAYPRCVVMAPTRELAAQIGVEAEKLCYSSTLATAVVYGGADQRRQVRDLARGADVVVATPGRLTDFVDRGIVSLSYVSFLVLDEADRMLDMGFEPQIRRIVEKADMPPKERRQTLLFSATFPPEIQKLASSFLRTYVWIAVGRVGSAVENIEQRLIRATNDKRAKLLLVVRALADADGRTLIFVQKKRTATWLKSQLRRGGPPDAPEDVRFPPILAEDIHGDRSQSQREAALRKFRDGTVRVLVATDVAARGLDIGGVEHVINMDLPFAKEEFDSYVHRIGRTGRAGHGGLATSLYVPGRDAKMGGNGAIARPLLEQMRETGSEIPDWFVELPECGGDGGGVNGGGGRGGVMGKKFGGMDVRDHSAFSGGGGGRDRQQQQQQQQRNGTEGNGGGRGRGGRGNAPRANDGGGVISSTRLEDGAESGGGRRAGRGRGSRSGRGGRGGGGGGGGISNSNSNSVSIVF